MGVPVDGRDDAGPSSSDNVGHENFATTISPAQSVARPAPNELREEEDYKSSSGSTTGGASSLEEESQKRETGENTTGCVDDDDRPGEKVWPEEVGRSETLSSRLRRICSSWSYSYMDPILMKGRRQFKEGDHLVQEDLYRVPEDMRAEYLLSRFRPALQEGEGLVTALWKISAPIFVPAGFWEFLYMISRVSLPLSMRQLLLVLEANPGKSVVEEGLPYAITMSLAALLSALSQNRTIFLSTKSGIVLRAALTTTIYEHAIRLTPEGKAGLTTGEVTNLVAVDTQKLFDVMLEGHYLWSCPLMIAIVSALLWVLVGPEFMLGVALLILFVPVIQAVVVRMLNIRQSRSELTDVRVNILTSMLQGIRVTKLNHYESKVEEHVGAVREREMTLLRKELSMWGWVLTTAVVSPLLATALSYIFFVLVRDGNVLTPADAFTALLLFSILRFPINLGARVVGKLAQAVDAARRISNFLDREIRPEQRCDPPPRNGGEDDSDSQPVLDMKNASFTMKPQDDALTIGVTGASASLDGRSSPGGGVPESEEGPRPDEGFTIRDISLEVKKSQVVAVVGKVGSGKSLLLRALLGEVPSLDGTELTMSGAVSYAGQEPFILNASLRENVLFGSDFVEDKYERALDACSLRADVLRLGQARDLTQIGERGVTLSGGQKQRVALARAIYAKPDVALLDDVFSALDSNTASAVFDGLFGSKDGGMLQSSGTLLVTHAVQFLPRVDFILVMSNGSTSFFGTWAELQASKGSSHEIIDAIQTCDHQNDDKDVKEKSKFLGKVRREGILERDGHIMTAEDREYGKTSLWVWVMWFRNAGGWPFFFMQLVLLVLDRGFYAASDWWIAIWADAAYEGTTRFGVYFPPQSEGREAQVQYVSVFAVIVTTSVMFSALRSQWAVAGGARCARKMFTDMTHSVLRAPMRYFDTTPLGRVLNRFTYDVEVLDIELSVSMTGFMISLSWLISAVVIMIVILPWMTLALVPVGTVYFLIQLYYRMSGPDLQRIDAMSRSPIQANLAEGLEGSTTIIAFRKERKFARTFRQNVDQNSSAMLNFVAAQRWLGLRIELLGASIIFTLCIVIVSANGYLGIAAGAVGLAIQWAVVFSIALNLFFVRWSESEARMTSIERVNQTSKLPQEAAWETDASIELQPCWPTRGDVVFDHLCMRYRTDLPLALNSVSFELPSGTRCGVVGRTGSGKTSLTAALFRLVEAESGRILLDGVDLSKIGLSDVRGRNNGLRMIPQDPVLFAGTIRDCLDPFRCESDEKILEALQAVNHRGSNERGKTVLNDLVEEGGANYSVGERQLLCLARAIVEEPRVLVLDEATASVDTATDGFIQEMLRSRFRNTTLLTIAHRLHTIMDYDTVIVMEDGRAVEVGAPADLLQNPKGVFTSFVEATGSETAANLRRIANGSV